MKQETIDLLRKELKDMTENKRVQRNISKHGYTYEIESIPVLVERTKEGNCGEITFPQIRLIYESENTYE